MRGIPLEIVVAETWERAPVMLLRLLAFRSLAAVVEFAFLLSALRSEPVAVDARNV